LREYKRKKIGRPAILRGRLQSRQAAKSPPRRKVDLFYFLSLLL
jgi:hypothetical protein